MRVLLEDPNTTEAPDPIGAVKFRLDQMSITREELAKLRGEKNRVSVVLHIVYIRFIGTHVEAPGASNRALKNFGQMALLLFSLHTKVSAYMPVNRKPL